MARSGWVSLLPFVVLATASACDRARAPSEDAGRAPVEIATLDSLLTELGGVPAE